MTAPGPARREVARAQRPSGVLGRTLATKDLATRAVGPWSRYDVARSSGMAAIGLLGLLVCAYGTGAAKTYDRQLLWTAFALLSLAFGVVGGVVWILSGMRSVRLLRREVLLELSPCLSAARPHSELTSTVADGVYTGSAMARFHGDACPFSRGKELTVVSRDEALSQGLRACEVCSP